jgi:hypothetical protein
MDTTGWLSIFLELELWKSQVDKHLVNSLVIPFESSLRCNFLTILLYEVYCDIINVLRPMMLSISC